LPPAQQIAGVGTYVFDDAADSMMFVSPEYAAIHGKDAQELLGTASQTLHMVHPDDKERVVAGHQASMETGSQFDIEYRIVRPDGEVRFVRDMGEVLPDPSSGGTRTIGAVLDLTDIREAELDLAEREAILSFAQEVAGIGYLIYDSDQERTVEVSDMAARICGRTPEDMMTSWSDALSNIHPDDHDAVRQGNEIADSGEIMDIEYRVLRDDGIRYVHEVAV